MKLSLSWAQENSNVDLLKIGREKLLDKIGSQLGAIDEVVKQDSDTIVDIENKMFTHRPDCFGILGLARELAGIQGLAFKSPTWYLKPAPAPKVSSKLELIVRNEAAHQVPRFMALAMNVGKVESSPNWLRSYLVRSGVKPVNNIVDITNYMMLLTAQPLHAFDYDKLAHLDGAKIATIIARKAKKNEEILLLNGKKYKIEPGTLVLSSRNQAVDIAGIMGGKETEVDSTTVNIVLTCANFDLYAVRRASMHHGLFTDAVTRFSKGQSPHQTDRVIAKTIEMVAKLAGGKVASKLSDLKGELKENKPVKLDVDFINSRLGLKLSAKEISKTLSNVEFSVSFQKENLQVTAPFWRTDIEIPEDIVEEVGRLVGYDKLPLQLPLRTLKATSESDFLGFKRVVREHLASLGANEVLTYSFVHGNLMKKAGQNPDNAFQLSNAISPDLQYYRTSLLPSLLDKVHQNMKSGFPQFVLFEFGKAHVKGHNDEIEKNLPKEEERLVIVSAFDSKTMNEKANGAPYYWSLKLLDSLMKKLNLQYGVEPESQAAQKAVDIELAAPFEQRRTGFIKIGNDHLGIVGEMRQEVIKSFKLPTYVSALELDIAKLHQNFSGESSYTTIPDFPKISQDITLRVTSDILFNELNNLLMAEIGRSSVDSKWTLKPISIYQPAKDSDHKHLTFRLTIASYKRTLTDKEVNKLLDKAAETASKKFKATRI